MNENLTEMVFVIDESGSMSGLEGDTIGGFNALVSRQKKEPGEALISSVLFSNTSHVVHDRSSLSNIAPMTGEDYVPGGCTALLDAVGDAISHIRTVHKYAREEDRPGRTLFVIITDGMENSSVKYSYKDIKRLIDDEKEKDGWEFLFLGANIDAAKVAGHMGIRRDNAVKYECDEVGTSVNYEALDKAIVTARRMSSKAFREGKAFAGGAWKASIEQDYAKRHR